MENETKLLRVQLQQASSTQSRKDFGWEAGSVDHGALLEHERSREHQVIYIYLLEAIYTTTFSTCCRFCSCPETVYKMSTLSVPNNVTDAATTVVAAATVGTLQAIVANFAGGCVVLGLCVVAFGWAVQNQKKPIAPRCTARPPFTVYNPSATQGHAQYRGGSPYWGWIPWVYSLSDDTLLKGVPGTGTQNDGLGGTLLHVNLDNIVLVRFHKLARKITLVATLLCLGLLLPLYITAPCLPTGEYDEDFSLFEGYHCQNVTNGHANSAYFRTTLGHVPDMLFFLEGYYRDDYDYDSRTSSTNNSLQQQHLMAKVSIRLHAPVLVLWIISLYAFYILRQEWIELIRFRRTYYLGREGVSHRSEWSKGLAFTTPTTNNTNNKNATTSNPDRDPWIPHPEQPDTPPNVEPYSILLGHLPILMLNGDNDEENLQSPQQPPPPTQIQFQLKCVKDCLEDIIPSEPGYSSPIVAVSILPCAVQVGLVWRKWYTTLTHQRRLKYIRDCIHSQMEEVSNLSSQAAGANIAPTKTEYKTIVRRKRDTALADSVYIQGSDENDFVSSTEKSDYKSPTMSSTNSSAQPPTLSHRSSNDRSAGASQYYVRAMGTMVDNDTDNGAFLDLKHDTLEFGPEQLAVYSRELAQSASNCCPRGCHEERLPRLSIEELALEEQACLELFQRSKHELEFARTQLFSKQQPLSSSRRRAPAALPRLGVYGNGGNHEENEVEEKDEIWSRNGRKSANSTTNSTTRRRRRLEEEEVPLIMELPSVRSASLPPLRPAADDSVNSINPLLLSNVGHDVIAPIVGKTSLSSYDVVPTTADTDNGTISSSPSYSPSELFKHYTHWFRHGVISIAASWRPIVSGWCMRVTNLWEQYAWRYLRDPKWWIWIRNELRVRCWTCTTIGIPELYSNTNQESSYAVVTFTSRQAAAAARQSIKQKFLANNSTKNYCGCARYTSLEVLAGGGGDAYQEKQQQREGSSSPELKTYSGMMRSITLHDVPTPPLADAAAWKGRPCRNLCRPVTVTLNDFQKSLRLYLILCWLAMMYIFYTIPLTYAASQVDPETIAYYFPEHTKKINKLLGINIPTVVSGLASALIWSLFFMLIPQVFKLIAYFGSQATSLAQAERRALQYFWWFMVITAFMGPNLAYCALGAMRKDGERFADGLREVLIRLAGTTPTFIAPTWLNWIIYRFTIILPINFLLQFNTFLFSFLGWKCCSRITIGGGPGGPVPYRIYVDSGVVFMCTAALGPASPIVALAALAYFFVSEPLLRRNVIFIYRPRYDDGGLRWMFVFDMIISALIVGHFLLALQMGLKNAFGPCLLSASAIPVTIWFQWYCKRRFRPAFENTSLLRTNLLDGLDSLNDMSMQRREEHRRFLVDTHKAAYIPVCIAGSESAAMLTATPARVIPHSIDSDSQMNSMLKKGLDSSEGTRPLASQNTTFEGDGLSKRRKRGPRQK